jgi:hypothetical protein
LPAADEIRLHQRRRHRERAGDVVEAARGIVGRQELARIDLEREQVANRVGVLRAVQSMQTRRRQVRGGGPIELALHPRNHRLQRGGFGAARVGRRHQPRSHLADDRLGHVYVIAQVREIELIEQQVGRS